jgi:predicted transcriptional regulator
MGIELRERSLVDRLQQLAKQQGGGAEQVLEDAVRDYLDRFEKEAIH